VINYTKLNDALLPIRYPLPSKESLFAKTVDFNIVCKFDLESVFWQTGINPSLTLVMSCFIDNANGDFFHLLSRIISRISIAKEIALYIIWKYTSTD
jgi:hypothetical protein